MKVLFVDTESTSLTAIMGRILAGSFVGLEGQPYTYRVDKQPWKSRDIIDDSKLAVAIRNELESANLIVTWNGKMHDVPLVNARLAKHNQRQFQPQLHIDLMYYAGGTSMKIGSRKLDNVARFFSLPEQKTPLDWDTWQRAGAGDKASMDLVVKHCEADVLVLREAYKHLIPYVRNIHR